MIELTPSQPGTGAREKRQTPFFQLGNEILDVFEPLMGPYCLAIYTQFARRAFRDPELNHSILDLAEAMEMGGSTVWRSLEILEYLELIQLVRIGGSRESKCKLLNSEQAAERLGAKYQKGALRWYLPREAENHWRNEIRAIRQRQQGKARNGETGGNSPRTFSREGARSIPELSDKDCRRDTCSVSQRNGSVSQETCQRIARDTQSGTHLLKEETRVEEGPTPTPSHEHESQKANDSPDEDGRALSIRDWATKAGLAVKRWAERPFTGVMNEMRAHLLDTSIPPSRHLANGAADWSKFGFDSLAVQAAEWCSGGSLLALTLSASDPVAAGLGLQKYHRKWNASLRKWYRCEVRVELIIESFEK